MRHCTFFLGNDTGSMHMAVAAGLKCVAVFSSRSAPGAWYPYGPGHIVLRKFVPCEGCQLVECVENRMQCILAITVDEVLSTCREMARLNCRVAR